MTTHTKNKTNTLTTLNKGNTKDKTDNSTGFVEDKKSVNVKDRNKV